MAGTGSGLVGGSAFGNNAYSKNAFSSNTFTGKNANGKGVLLPGRTAKSNQSGYNSGILNKGGGNKTAARDPMADLYGFADQFGSWSGGSGGSGGSAGNGAAIQALVDQINQKKANGTDRFNTNKGRLADIYGQLKTSLEPNAGLTAERYDKAIAQSNTGGAQIAQTAVTQQNAQNAQRNTGLAALGVDATAAPSVENSTTTQGLADLAKSNASWGNLQGTLSAAQQSRDKLDVQGAQDAGILAERSLTDNYETYVRALEDQISTAWAGYEAPSGGSGGSAATYSNPMLDKLNNSIFENMMDKTLNPSSKSTPSASSYARVQSKIGTGTNKLGKAYSTPELVAKLGNDYSTYLSMQGK